MQILLGSLLTYLLVHLVFYLLVRTVHVCRRTPAWVRWLVALVDAAFLVPPVVALGLYLLRQVVSDYDETLGLIETLDPILEFLGQNVGVFGGLPLTFFAWKLLLFYAVMRWESARVSTGRCGGWPAAPAMRGARRGRRRLREFREPLPWERGPTSY